MQAIKNLKGDLTGGFAAAVTSIPQAIGYGLIVFAPLGLHYADYGILAGFYGAIVCSIFAATFGGTPAQINGPIAPLSLLMLSILTVLLSRFPAGSVNINLALSWLFITVILAGVFQILFSVARLGNLIKYLPYPVFIGFMTGVGVILIVKQFEAFIGTHHLVKELAFFERLIYLQPATILIGIVTLLTIYYMKKWSKNIPTVLFGIVVGTALYYLIKLLFPHVVLSPVLGYIHQAVPNLSQWGALFHSFSWQGSVEMLPYILISAFVLALFGTLVALISSLSVDLTLNARHNSNQELFGQGVANIASACLGGLMGSGSPPRNLVNIEAGGRTRLSGVFCGLSMLLILLFVRPLIEILPTVVIAAVIIQIGISILNYTFFLNAYRVIRQSKQKHEFIFDITVVILVALVTIFFNLTIAILIGIIIAIIFYIYKMGRLTLRREINIEAIRSKKMRPIKCEKILKMQGKKAMILELQGSLFFGSAEKLAIHIESLAEKVNYFILDFKRVLDIDSTAIQALQRMCNRLIVKNKTLLFSYTNQSEAVSLQMLNSGFIKNIHEQYFFDDTDHALEWVEDELLAQSNVKAEIIQYELSDVSLFRNVSKVELNLLLPLFKRNEYEQNQFIFEMGGKESDLYILVKGEVSIELFKPGYDHPLRLLTLMPGTVFGEMAFLSNKPRSAFARATENCIIFSLSQDDFIQFEEIHPHVAVLITRYLAIELATRLESTSAQLSVLERL